MKTFRWFLAGVVTAWLGCASVHAQPGYQPMLPPPPTIPNGDEAPPVSAWAPSGGFSDWIMYKRECCEGLYGQRTPLFTEAYLRVGPSMPVGGRTLGQELQTGWSIMGGVRALFFNESMTAAWTVDPHIIHTHESGGARNTAFPLVVFNGPNRTVFGAGGVPGVTIRGSHRTMVGLGLGRECYLWQPADSKGNVWRVGWDAGGRYGSQRLDFHETRRITDVIGGIFAAVHADVDIPTNNGVFYTGVRLEWAYTWSDVLQRTSDVMDINVFWTVGRRF